MLSILDSKNITLTRIVIYVFLGVRGIFTE